MKIRQQYYTPNSILAQYCIIKSDFINWKNNSSLKRTHWFGKKNLSRTPSAWFSWGSKPDFRSCRMTVSYPSEMFFSFREKCCYMLIFANEYAVLIESFDNRFEATPFYHILYRWRKFFCFVYMYFVRLASSWWVVARGLSKLVKII